MKKCPYCKTLMNDDVNMCPNCLKDMSEISLMPEVKLTSSKKYLNILVYGVVLSLGGVVASLSQSINRENYQDKYDALAIEIENSTNQDIKNELINEALEYLTLVNECKFKEIFFYVVAGIGLVLLGVSLYFMIKNKLKKKEN